MAQLIRNLSIFTLTAYFLSYVYDDLYLSAFNLSMSEFISMENIAVQLFQRFKEILIFNIVACVAYFFILVITTLLVNMGNKNKPAEETSNAVVFALSSFITGGLTLLTALIYFVYLYVFFLKEPTTMHEEANILKNHGDTFFLLFVAPIVVLLIGIPYINKTYAEEADGGQIRYTLINMQMNMSILYQRIGRLVYGASLFLATVLYIIAHTVHFEVAQALSSNNAVCEISSREGDRHLRNNYLVFQRTGYSILYNRDSHSCQHINSNSITGIKKGLDCIHHTKLGARPGYDE